MFFGQTKIKPIDIGIVKTDREFKYYWLVFLQEIKKLDRCSFAELENRFKITNAETHRTVAELERRGLVETSLSNHRFYVECTDAGKFYVKTAANALASSI